MKNKLLPLSIVSIFIIIFIILFKGLQGTKIYIPETRINNEIPSFYAKLFYSNKVVNSSEIFHPDEYYLLNIWSSWCIPCRQEHPLLMGLIKNKKIKVIGINYKDNKKKAENFLNELGNPYKKIIFDKDGTIAIEWAAYGVPESFLIHDGNIVKKYTGPLSQNLIKEIESLIE